MSSYDNNAKHRNYHYKICDDVVVMIPVVIYSQKDFYLLEALNKKIEMLKAAGLIEFWHFQDFGRKVSDVPKKSSYPAVLTFTQLIGSFQLLLLGYISSAIVWLVEILILVMKDRNKIYLE